MPESTFQSQARVIGLGEAEQARLRTELARMGLTVRQIVEHAPVDTVLPHAVVPESENGRIATARVLLGRYADNEGRVTGTAVEGVVRLAGLSPQEARTLREAAGVRPAAVPASESARRSQDSPQTAAAGMAVQVVGAGAVEQPRRAVGAGSTADAVAAAHAVLDEDRFRRRPEKRLLTAEEEVGLAVLVRGGEASMGTEPNAREIASLPVTDIRVVARNCLVVHNQGLAHGVARHAQGQGLDHEDLAQHGMLGLLRAAVKFDPTMGNKFSTYATWWVRQAITRAIADEGSVIRIPVHLHEVMRKVSAAERRLQSEGRGWSAADVAVTCDLSVRKVEEIRRLSRRTDSLDRVIGDGVHLGDLVALERPLPSAEQLAVQALHHEYLLSLLDAFDERSARILLRRTGIDGDEKATLDELGREFGVTRERIRQVETKAIGMLRERLLADELGAKPGEPKEPRTRQRGAKKPASSTRAAAPAEPTPGTAGAEAQDDKARNDEQAAEGHPVTTATDVRTEPGPTADGHASVADDAETPGEEEVAVRRRLAEADVPGTVAPVAVPGPAPGPGSARTDEPHGADWQQAIALPARFAGGVAWLAEYALLALGRPRLAELLGSAAADSVAAAAREGRMLDRPVVTALEVLQEVFDTLKNAGLRPEDFFERPSEALNGALPQRYLAERPLVGRESRIAIRDALCEFSARVAAGELSPEPLLSPLPMDEPGEGAAPEAEQPHPAPPAENEAQLDELEAVLLRRVDRTLHRQEQSLRRQAQERIESMREQYRERLQGARQSAESDAAEAARALEAAQLRTADTTRELRELREESGVRIAGLEERLRQVEAELVRSGDTGRRMEEWAAEQVKAVEQRAAQWVDEVERAAAQRIAETERDADLLITGLQTQLDEIGDDTVKIPLRDR
ncbi:sigma-70 family RNA polymerase sigma factor [Streptomyces sp. NPDC087917]|uniref:sigma-70 family RNA polymerase sigma factor n=1 Tax=Streptomyces sp. NPDC087917 TaxID=3155060 RepID=UPI00343499E8